jgi:hypothetical protein
MVFKTRFDIIFIPLKRIYPVLLPKNWRSKVRAIVNGKLVDLPTGATVEDLRAKLPEIGQDDVMEEGFGGTRPLKDTEALKEGSKVWTVPKIVKG